ncbi:MAG: glycosyltransferase [Chloroflexota bacterium]|nr:glycosyltransferase [Chloroflexota bacterium]
MPTILYLTHFAPIPLRRGAENRTYQILFDLQAAVGDKNVHVFDLTALKNTSHRRLRLPWCVQYALYRLRVIGRENVYRIFAETHFTMHKFDHPLLLERYRAAFEAVQPALVVVQHSACLWSLPFQHARGIPTLICTQNFDSLDNDADLTRKQMLNVALGDLATEIHALRQYDARLFISKIETAFTNGLGYPSLYYPYAPVGAIRAFYAGVRARRLASVQKRGTFVMLGTAEHLPIRDGMIWLLAQIERHGLPDGARLIVAGKGTDTLVAGRTLPGVECLGWLNEEQLSDLLVTADAMLLPKFRGFGSATRVAEMALAGLPMIASDYVTQALDAPPSLIAVPPIWDAWRAVMERLMRDDAMPAADDPPAESPSALTTLVQSLL